MTLLPARGTSITQLGDAFALFNCDEQRLYEIDERAAWAWHFVFKSAGVDRGHMSAQLSSRFRLANADADTLLDRYIELGILALRTDPISTFAVRLNDAQWGIACPPALSGELTALFRGIAVPLESPWKQHCLTIDSKLDRYELIAGGKCLGTFGPSEVVPAVKSCLTDALLQTDFMLALHAALLRIGDAQLLIAGASGAGKTTLALALAAQSGCAILADDIVMVDEPGRLRGIPFPIAVKDGSWPLLQDFYPQLASCPAHSRSDGKIVKFLACEGDAGDGSTHPATTMIFIRRSTDGRCSLSAMPPLMAFQRLLAEAASPTHRLTDRAFGALAEFVNRSQAFEMAVGNLQDAVRAIRAL